MFPCEEIHLAVHPDIVVRVYSSRKHTRPPTRRHEEDAQDVSSGEYIITHTQEAKECELGRAEDDRTKIEGVERQGS